MKTITEIEELMASPYKVIEKSLGIKIRNGQAIEGIRSALSWVVK